MKKPTSERVMKEYRYWESAAKSADIEREISDHELDNKKCINRIYPYIKNCKNVLEIGSGIGRLTIPLAKKMIKSKFVGIDISDALVSYARSTASIDNVKNVEFKVNDGRNLPKTKALFDGAYSMITFQHISEDGVIGYINEVSKAMGKGGIFRFQFVQGDERIAFSQQYSLTQVISWLVEAGFTAKDTKEEGLYSPNWVWITAIKNS